MKIKCINVTVALLFCKKNSKAKDINRQCIERVTTRKGSKPIVAGVPNKRGTEAASVRRHCVPKWGWNCRTALSESNMALQIKSQ